MTEKKVIIVKEGHILKRGEVIKNWRIRYFYLLSNGNFVGYKEKPVDGPSQECENIFNLTNCKIIRTEIPKNNCFLLRCFVYTKIIDRLFRCSSQEERDDWVEKIKKIGCPNPEKEEKIQEIQQSDNMTIGPYKLLAILGEGTFGKVILAHHTTTKKYAAVKVLKKEVIYENEEMSHIESEGRILKSFNHPFLISMIDFYQTKDRIFFVMDFLNGGELFYHLRACKGFSESRTRFYTAEVILALQFLHSMKITYRDLKLENTILDHEGHVKLCDFGLCKENTTHVDSVSTFCGTREYLAPEILLEKAKGYSIDWWCLGVFIFECLTTDLPFSSIKDDKILFEKILNGKVEFTKYHLSLSVQDLITSLLIKNPKRRLGCNQNDGEDIKKHSFFSTINWEDVLNKKLKPEFVPNVSGPGDTRFFKDSIQSIPIKFSPPKKDIEFELKI